MAFVALTTTPFGDIVTHKYILNLILFFKRTNSRFTIFWNPPFSWGDSLCKRGVKNQLLENMYNFLTLTLNLIMYYPYPNYFTSFQTVTTNTQARDHLKTTKKENHSNNIYHPPHINKPYQNKKFVVQYPNYPLDHWKIITNHFPNCLLPTRKSHFHRIYTFDQGKFNL